MLCDDTKDYLFLPSHSEYVKYLKEYNNRMYWLSTKDNLSMARSLYVSDDLKVHRALVHTSFNIRNCCYIKIGG